MQGMDHSNMPGINHGNMQAMVAHCNQMSGSSGARTR